MKYLLDPLKGLLGSLFGLSIHPAFAAAFVLASWQAGGHPLLCLAGALPFLLGLIACLCIEWSAPDATGYQRGKLPDWAYLWCTPDEDAPGDVMGEPAVQWCYAHLGKTITALYWHLERNRGMGLSFLFSRKTDDGTYLDGNAWGFIEIPSGAWRWQQKIFPGISIGVGTQTTKVKGQMWIRPWVGIKTTHHGRP